MIVKNIMQKDVQVINQDKTLSEAAVLMREHKCGSIPVEKDDRLVGMITDRDIALRGVAEGRDTNSEPIKNCMSEGIKYCFETDSIEDVGRMMSQNQLRRLPVLNAEKRLVGIVSVGDFARASGDEKLLYKTMNNVCH